jgi:hypothetical protein
MIETSAPFTTDNAFLLKLPIYLIEIAGGYTRAFTNRDTGVAGQYDWIESIEDHQITINDLDGGADLGEFTFTVQDRGNAITGDFPGFIFEGKAVTVKTGFVGMSQSDFALLFTGKIDSVASTNGNADYVFTCVDNKDVLTKVIYTTADDGRPTDQDHRRTLNGHPLDILVAILEDEIGLTIDDYNTTKLDIYKNGIFAGVQFTFSIDSPPAAKDFIEQQICKPLGAYMWVNNQGQIDFNFFRRDNTPPVYGGCCIACFTDGSGTIIGYPFLCAPPVGSPLIMQVPTGATKISLGLNDEFYSDNIGSWNFTLDGTPFTVTAGMRPWELAPNPTRSYSTTGSSAGFTSSITAGTLITIAYISGTCSISGGHPFVGPGGTAVPSNANTLGPGQYFVLAFAPAPITTPDFMLTNDNMEAIPEVVQADLVNAVTFRFDKDSEGKFQADFPRAYTISVARYGQYGDPNIIESDGMRSGLQGFFLAAFTSNMIFQRYGLKNLMFEEVHCHWTAALLEPGDLVAMTTDKVPDRTVGVMGITGKLFEVLDRTWSFQDGIVTLKLLDASYLLNLGQFLIAPDGTPDFTSASSYEQARYMFLSNDSDEYSDTSAAHTLG